MLKLIPTPKKVIEKEGLFNFNTVKIKKDNVDRRLHSVLDKLPSDEHGTELEIIIENKNSEKYIIEINEAKILLSAESLAGAFYGIQTLRQIFENEKIPLCYIEDYPDFSHRGVYHDVTRGKIPKMETLKAFIDELAYYKINSLQLYVEHTFEFKEYEDITKRTGYLTAQDIKELDCYCKENFIEFIPSLSTFGHLFELLNTDKYKHLCEINDYKTDQVMWIDRMRHHTIDPLSSESFELVKSLIDQYLPLFSSDKFNICCDETFDLKAGKHSNMDTGKLYIDFVVKIIEYVKSKGKTVMMWGDVLAEHQEYISYLPKDVIFLNWDYGKEPDEKNVSRIYDLDRPQILCPGTWSWSSLCENLSISVPNIEKMAEFAMKYKSLGVLNTNWGDHGNPCSIELAMCGIVFGAEKSWNVKSDNNEFFSKLDKILYNHDGAFEIVKKVSKIHEKARWRKLVYCYSALSFNKSTDSDAFLGNKENIINICIDCELLIDKLKKEVWEKDEYRKELLIALEGTMVIAELFAKVYNFEIKRKSNTDTWLEKYRKMWFSKNQKNEFHEIEKMFHFMEKCR